MIRSRSVTPHLFAQWGSIARRIRENKRVVMFLDFDGTLVPNRAPAGKCAPGGWDT